MTNKTFFHKIYNGAAFVKTLDPKIVMNLPTFQWEINGGMGEMIIDLALTLKEFGENYEGDSIVFGYKVETWVQGANETAGTKIYDGLITSYDPIMSDDGKEFIRLHIVSQLTTLENQLLKSGSNTEVVYSSQDPSVIFKDIIDKYNSTIDYTASSVETSGTTVSYTFTFITYLEAIKKTLELCPAYWYWYIDANNAIYLSSTNFDTVNHKLYLGKEVSEITAKKSIDELKNIVYFKGGGSPPLYKKYERTSSQTAYGIREEQISDERVTVTATAQIIADKFLDEKDHPISIVSIKIFDDSMDTSKGYDIESLKPGQMIQIFHPNFETKVTLWDVALWDVDFWDFDIRYSLGLPMQIRKINYNYDYAILELTTKAEDIAFRIEDINRNLDVVRSEGIPSAPT